MLTQILEKRLLQQQEKNLYRQRVLTEENSKLISFANNDYLGLAKHPLLIAAFKKGAEKFGVGSGGSQLIGGYKTAHQELEAVFADFLGRERALVFANGYMANLGVLTALSSRNASIYQDKYNHASLIDGGVLSRANLTRYLYRDIKLLPKKLKRDKNPIKLIATDGIFSIDGRLAPLPQLAELAKKSHGLLIVDDTHGVGLLGDTGAGSVEHFALKQTDVPLLSFSLAKAFGCSGAIVAGNHVLTENIIQFARTFTFTSALPPALAYAAKASLQIVKTEIWRREKLAYLITYFKKLAAQLELAFIPSDTAIQSLMIGDNNNVLKIQQQLLMQGLQVAAIRPPTVPPNTSRLRITLNCNHTEKQIEKLLENLVALTTKC